MGMPDYNQVNAGEGATPITHDLAVQARKETNSDVYSSLMGGTEAAKGLMRPDNYGAGLAMQNPMSAAIAQKTGRANAIEDQKLKFEMGQKAKDLHFQKLMQVEQAVSQEQNNNFQKALLKWKQKQASKSARAALVGSILGTGGAIAGAAFSGGNPGAAMAGSAAGSAAGQALAGGFDGV
jgi:hypothetical protein